MAVAERIRIEVVAGVPDQQVLVSLSVPASTSVREAIALAEIADRLPGIDPARCPLAVWGRKVTSDRRLRDGDRVEVLRPLLIDPRDARRALASEGRVMGPRKAGDP